MENNNEPEVKKDSKMFYTLLGVGFIIAATLVYKYFNKKNDSTSVAQTTQVADSTSGQQQPAETVETIMNKIKGDSAWSAQVQERAQKNGKTFEDQIKIEAQYVINQQTQTPLPVETEESIKAKIKADPKYTSEVKARAEKSGVSFEKQLDDEVKWIISEKNKPAETVESVMEKFKSDPKLSAEIKKKADKAGKTFEQQLKEDAQWVIDQKNKQ
jgi:hypothetical protein